MDPRILMFVAVAAVLVLGYFVVMRVFYRDSKQLDKQVDLTKMKVWKDDED
jgi:low affinity Fe/Cu permease